VQHCLVGSEMCIRDSHFGFEGASWYWHFVDVVWLCLYILVYWL
jgi:heme/copper-type cytochrome/quinol oxidase subunit 3